VTNSEHPLGLGGRDRDISLPVYLMVPVDPAKVRIEIETEDTADGLIAIQPLSGGEADVLADGRYASSLRIDPKPCGQSFDAIPTRARRMGATFGELG